MMNAKSIIAICAASGATALASTVAMAGGTAMPIVDVAPVEIPVTPAGRNWEGGYVGGALGFGFGGDDTVGLQAFDGSGPIGRATDITDVKISGVTGSAHVGYRWQRGQWVVGPNLAAELSGISDSSSGSFSLNGFDYDTTVESEIKSVIDLTLKTGYLVDPTTMIYGVAGVSRGSFNYSFETTGTGAGSFSGSSSEDFTSTGYVLGFGVERAFSDRLSGFGEFNYRSYGTNDITTPLAVGDGTTRATPSHSAIKLGVNYAF